MELIRRGLRELYSLFPRGNSSAGLEWAKDRREKRGGEESKQRRWEILSSERTAFCRGKTNQRREGRRIANGIEVPSTLIRKESVDVTSRGKERNARRTK